MAKNRYQHTYKVQYKDTVRGEALTARLTYFTGCHRAPDESLSRDMAKRKEVAILHYTRKQVA